jgi:hypothetical protein
MDNPTRRLPDQPPPDSEHPTRRLPDPPPAHDPLADYRVSATENDPLNPPARQPAVRPCLRCRTPMRPAQVGTDRDQNGFVTKHVAPLSVKAGKGRSDCLAWVCPTCGTTELVADSPFTLFAGEILDER